MACSLKPNQAPEGISRSAPTDVQGNVHLPALARVNRWPGGAARQSMKSTATQAAQHASRAHSAVYVICRTAQPGVPALRVMPRGVWLAGKNRRRRKSPAQQLAPVRTYRHRENSSRRRPVRANGRSERLIEARDAETPNAQSQSSNPRAIHDGKGGSPASCLVLLLRWFRGFSLEQPARETSL
jgi:hypothetical protein